MIHGRIQVIVGNHFIDLFDHCFSIYQPFQFCFCEHIRFIDTVDKMMNHTVPACIHPVIFRLGLWIMNMIIAVIHNIPRTVHICFSESVSVIPFFYLVISVIHFIVMQHGLYFFICKTEGFIKFCICNRIYFEIVQSGKDAFFCNAQAARQNGKGETAVCFQNISEHISKQQYHFIIISIFMGFCHRNIVFVNQDNHLLFIVNFQQFCQFLKTAGNGVFFHISCQKF